MTNLILRYRRNWKDRFEVCIENPANYTAEQAEQMLRECLIDGEFFYPQKVGLPFSVASDWYALGCVEVAAEEIALPGKTLETLLEELKESNKAYLRPIKIYKIPAVIPIRLAVCWLEFLRQVIYP